MLESEIVISINSALYKATVYYKYYRGVEPVLYLAPEDCVEGEPEFFDIFGVILHTDLGDYDISGLIDLLELDIIDKIKEKEQQETI